MNSDTICAICHYLDNKKKIYFLSTCTQLHALKSKVSYKKQVLLIAIEKLFYFDQFENVYVHFVHNGRLPQNTKILTYYREFDAPIDYLKGYSKITHITFGDGFSHPIIGLLPPNLKNLTLGYCAKQRDIRELPKTVTHLKLCIPLGHISVPPCIYHVPDTITHLILRGYGGYHGMKWPAKLKQLVIKNGIGMSYYARCDIPEGVEYANVTCTGDCSRLSFPDSLKHLRMHFSCDATNIPTIPPNVETLELSILMCYIIPNVNYPVTLKHLKIQGLIENFAFESLPPSVTQVDLYHEIYDRHHTFPVGMKVKRLMNK